MEVGKTASTDVLDVISKTQYLAWKHRYATYTTLHVGYVLHMDKSGLLRRAIRSLVDKKPEDKAMEVFKKSMKQLDTGGVEKQHSVHLEPCVQNVINGLQGRITLSPFICSFLGDSTLKSSLNEADISASKLIKKVEELSMQMVYNYGSYFLSHYPEANQIYGRDKEIVRVLGILSRRRKTNKLLVGDSGGGKTAVVAGLARRVARGEVPPNLLGLELISLNMRALLQGRDQTRFLKEVAEAKSMILFIDDFHILIGAHNSKNAALVLKEILDMSHLLCIGATTVKGHREYTKADDTLERRFKVVRVPQPTIDDTLSILRERKSGLESQHRVRILDSALVAVVNFSSRYLKDVLCNHDIQHWGSCLFKGYTKDVAREQVLEMMKQSFTPELLNCIDDKVVFYPLDRVQIRSIVDLLAQNVISRFHEKGVDLHLDSKALDLIASYSYDEKNGARALSRVLEKVVTTRVEQMMIAEKIDDKSTIHITPLKNPTPEDYLRYSIKRKRAESS